MCKSFPLVPPSQTNRVRSAYHGDKSTSEGETAEGLQSLTHMFLQRYNINALGNLSGSQIQERTYESLLNIAIYKLKLLCLSGN